MKSKKKRTRRWLVALGCVLAAVLLLGGAAVAVLHFYKPTPGGDVPFHGAEEYTKDEGTYQFLLIGYDRIASLADVVMLVSLDTGAHTLAIMQFPRDTYIETAAGLGKPKINASFAYDLKHTADGDTLCAAENLAADLEKTLCVDIDYAAVIDLDGFAAAIDTLLPGGIPIEVPYALDYEDPEQDLYIHLPAGHNILDGEGAEQFVRFRSGFALADVGRVDAQKNFLAALFAECRRALADMNVATLTSLLGDVLPKMQTNVSLLDAVYFAREVLRLDPASMTMMTAPGEASRSDEGTWYYQINREDARTAINLYFNVFDVEISDVRFDEDYALTDERDKTLLPLYLDESGKYLKVYTAAGIEGEPIPIRPKS